MQRSPKKARHVVTKDSEAPCLVDKGLNENDGGNQVPPVEIEVWEVSDDDGEEHSPPSSNGGYGVHVSFRVLVTDCMHCDHCAHMDMCRLLSRTGC